MNDILLNHALEYDRLCWFALPIHPVKKQPLIRWVRRQNRPPSPKEIEVWFREQPDARIGIATGK
jgi:hypothetical protein